MPKSSIANKQSSKTSKQSKGNVDAVKRAHWAQDVVKEDRKKPERSRKVSIEDMSMLIDEGPQRAAWNNHIEFMLACVGYAVGLGNIWRFPYKCYKNGGGAFLLPYFVALFIAGIPTFYMELALGQYVSLGPMNLFKRLMPALQGIGVAMVVVSFLCAVYYNMIVAWILYYMFASLISMFKGSELEWQSCSADNWWNTPYCVTPQKLKSCLDKYSDNVTAAFTNVSEAKDILVVYNHSCHVGIGKNSSVWLKAGKQSPLPIVMDFDPMSVAYPSEEYFKHYVLQQSSDVNEVGSFSMGLFLCLVLAWLVCYLCLLKGVKSTGKVVYFSATFPYFVLVALFGFGLSLDGSGNGISFYVTPDFSRLKDPAVWQDAFSQIFYSLGTGFGSLITMSSYNQFNNNCMRDALIVACLNCLTSFFAGFVIFSFVGYMAKQVGREVGEVVKDGAMLTFVAYPEAFSQMTSMMPIWGAGILAFVFFFMLLTLGIDSQFAMVETITTAITDAFPNLRQKHKYIIGIVCVVLTLMGIPFCFQNGMYIFEIFDTFAASYALFLLAFFELVLVSIFYREDISRWACANMTTDIRKWITTLGVFKFAADCKEMTGWPQFYCWHFAWVLLTPITLLSILISTITAGTTYSGWPLAMGVILTMSSLGCIPAFVIYRVLKIYYWARIGKIEAGKERKYIHKLFRTSNFWMPSKKRQKYKTQHLLQTGTLTLTHELPTIFKKEERKIDDEATEGVAGETPLSDLQEFDMEFDNESLPPELLDSKFGVLDATGSKQEQSKTSQHSSKRGSKDAGTKRGSKDSGKVQDSIALSDSKEAEEIQKKREQKKKEKKPRKDSLSTQSEEESDEEDEDEEESDDEEEEPESENSKSERKKAEKEKAKKWEKLLKSVP